MISIKEENKIMINSLEILQDTIGKNVKITLLSHQFV